MARSSLLLESLWLMTSDCRPGYCVLHCPILLTIYNNRVISRFVAPLFWRSLYSVSPTNKFYLYILDLGERTTFQTLVKVLLGNLADLSRQRVCLTCVL